MGPHRAFLPGWYTAPLILDLPPLSLVPCAFVAQHLTEALAGVSPGLGGIPSCGGASAGARAAPLPAGTGAAPPAAGRRVSPAGAQSLPCPTAWSSASPPWLPPSLPPSLSFIPCELAFPALHCGARLASSECGVLARGPCRSANHSPQSPGVHQDHPPLVRHAPLSAVQPAQPQGPAPQGPEGPCLLPLQPFLPLDTGACLRSGERARPYLTHQQAKLDRQHALGPSPEAPAATTTTTTTSVGPHQCQQGGGAHAPQLCIGLPNPSAAGGLALAAEASEGGTAPALGFSPLSTPHGTLLLHRAQRARCTLPHVPPR